MLNRIFTRRQLIDVLQGEVNNVITAASKKYSIDLNRKTKEDLFKELYFILDSCYKNEYYYKNKVLNEILLKKNSKNTVLLSEVQMKEAIADLVSINRKAVVYEIKTEFDDFSRLERQVNDYYRTFAQVSVVVHESALSKASSYIDQLMLPIGIWVLRNNGKLVMKRKPLDYYEKLSYESMFRVLRKYEFERVIVLNKKLLPQCSDFYYYERCLNLIKSIPIMDLYRCFLLILRNRKIHSIVDYENVDYGLRFLTYDLSLNPSQLELLKESVF